MAMDHGSVSVSFGPSVRAYTKPWIGPRVGSLLQTSAAANGTCQRCALSVSPVNHVVIVVAVTADQHAVCVRLAGDIDLAAEPDLAKLSDILATTRCAVVHIDLHMVTFAGSTLINFLFRLADTLPGHTSMTVCRPDAMTCELLELTGVDAVALVRADLPADWAAPPAAVNRPVAMHAVALA